MLHEENVRKIETFAYCCVGDVNKRAMEEIIGGALQGEPRERKCTVNHVERESVHIPLPGNQIMLLEILFPDCLPRAVLRQNILVPHPHPTSANRQTGMPSREIHFRDLALI